MRGVGRLQESCTASKVVTLLAGCVGPLAPALVRAVQFRSLRHQHRAAVCARGRGQDTHRLMLIENRRAHAVQHSRPGHRHWAARSGHRQPLDVGIHPAAVCQLWLFLRRHWPILVRTCVKIIAKSADADTRACPIHFCCLQASCLRGDSSRRWNLQFCHSALL